MPNEIEIRIVPMTTAHLAPVTEIERAVFRDPWTASAFIEVLSLSDKCWVAFLGEELVAYLVTQWVLDEAHILNVAVAPNAQRRGVARQLLNFLLGLCSARGMRDLFLEVRVSNAAAIALYEGLGFHELAVRTRYYPDGEDARLMHLHLTDVSSEEPDPEEGRISGKLQG
jgi:ribosomal-protein-alanine N-acetyltransferase